MHPALPRSTSKCSGSVTPLQCLSQWNCANFQWFSWFPSSYWDRKEIIPSEVMTIALNGSFGPERGHSSSTLSSSLSSMVLSFEWHLQKMLAVCIFHKRLKKRTIQDCRDWVEGLFAGLKKNFKLTKKLHEYLIDKSVCDKLNSDLSGRKKFVSPWQLDSNIRQWELWTHSSFFFGRKLETQS